MCDSLVLNAYLPEVKNKEEADARSSTNYPYHLRLRIDQDGNFSGFYPETMYLTSPLTGAQCKVTPILKMLFKGKSPIVEGYTVEANIPAMIIGNNILLENLVYLGSIVALFLLKDWLLDKGCTEYAVNAFKLKNCRLTSAVLTYLIPFPNHKMALAAKKEIILHAEAIRNFSVPTASNNNKVFEVGTTDDSTVYFKHHEHEISLYVKSGWTKKAFAKFDSTQIKNTLYAVGSNYLRPQIKYFANWLTAHERDTPDSWKDDINESDKEGMAIIRDYLRLNDGLRRRRPQPSHLAKLSAVDQEILELHFTGKSIKQHPNYLKLTTPGSQRSFMSKAKRRIKEALGIDISLDWINQNTKISSKNISSYLVYTSQYCPPQNLKPHVFCRNTVIAKIKELQSLIAAKAVAPKKYAKPRPSSTEESNAYVDIWKHIHCSGDDDCPEVSDVSDLMG